MQILIQISDLSLLFVSIAVFIFVVYSVEDAYKSEKKIRVIFFVIAGLISSIIPVRDSLTYTEVIKEDFSSGLNNISFLEGGDNMIFTTKGVIEEPVNLRVKDTWSHLVYLTDYEIKNKNTITLGYAFGNDKGINRNTAARGLTFTYRTRKWRSVIKQLMVWFRRK